MIMLCEFIRKVRPSLRSLPDSSPRLASHQEPDTKPRGILRRHESLDLSPDLAHT
jgi:hypothetical protein